MHRFPDLAHKQKEFIYCENIFKDMKNFVLTVTK